MATIPLKWAEFKQKRRRVDARTLEVTDKVKGEVMDHTKFEVSHDGKTLTLTVHGTGQANAQTFV
ncbi:MAG TPA: hypothetical protein VMG82_13000 [Candidatus Sulfotelmatobacter sp.]|nr:hypothetical protein [Candidatus Sulfotelmatobacter sp.]